MRFSTRELVFLAVFGAFWGFVEISLGAVLKSLNLPLSGVVLSAIGLTIALLGRLFVPQKGSTLFIGVIAMLLKLFSLGGVVIGPMVGILSEAIIAEIVLSVMGAPSLLAFVLAGGLGVLWAFVQPFVTGPVLFGRTIVVIWLDMLDRGSQLLGLPPKAAIFILLSFVGLHVIIGSLAGWLAWRVGQRLDNRIGNLSSPQIKH